MKTTNNAQPMKPFWVGWYADQSPFEWQGPWWITGYFINVDFTPGQATIVAAVMARDAAHAKQLIEEAHDEEPFIMWRFIEERPVGWEPEAWAEPPGSEVRYPRADWMQWPYPLEVSK